MLFSIVIVCLNCKKMIRNTLDSLVSQSFEAYECVIVDGASSDGTLSVIREYGDRIKGLRVFSEPDKGIYDAMNKGILRAKGDYIYFLNAGDVFVREDVLARVAFYTQTQRDIYYGNVKKGLTEERYPARLTDFYLIFREKMVCHQAVFAKRELLLKNNFDASLPICADRDWLIRCLHQKCSYAYMRDVAVVVFDTSGASSHYENFDVDSLSIAKKNGGIFALLFIRIKRRLGKFCRKVRRAR